MDSMRALGCGVLSTGVGLAVRRRRGGFFTCMYATCVGPLRVDSCAIVVGVRQLPAL